MSTPSTALRQLLLPVLFLALALSPSVRASLMITGIFEGLDDDSNPLQAIELFATAALTDAQVAEYLIKVYQTNGAEPDFVADLSFTGVAVNEGTFLYLTGGSLFAPIDLSAPVVFSGLYDFTGDPLTSFETGFYMYRLVHTDGMTETVIDQFGLAPDEGVTTFPATHAWDYFDTWLYRQDGTGPSGASFDINEWIVRADVDDPFPAGTYIVIPEPGTLALVVLAALACLRFGRRRA